MVLSGVFANAIGVAVGGIIGTFFGSKIPEKVSDGLMSGLALCVIFTGIGGITEKSNIIVAVLSISIGAVVGEIIDINRRIEGLGNFVQSKFPKDQNVSIAEGFVNASLFVCMGAMSIVGAIESGMMGDPSTYYTKAIVDTLVVAILATTLGRGAVLSSVSILVFQGSLTIISGFVAHLLTDATITQMAYVGSILIFAVGMNMLKVTKIKVANLVLAPFIPILFQRWL